MSTRQEKLKFIDDFETECDKNTTTFRESLDKLSATKDSKEIGDLIDAHNKLHDYIIKSRQAGHPKVTVYGSVATAGAGLIVSAVLALFGFLNYSNQYSKNEADVILKVLEITATPDIEANMTALRNAGLISRSPSQIDALSKWRPVTAR
jgi:hypothetical protein